MYFHFIKNFQQLMLVAFCVIPLSLFPQENQIDIWHENTVLIDEHQPKKVLIPTQGIGNTWRNNLEYDDAAWLDCTGGVGYDIDNGYEDYIDLDVAGSMYFTAPNPNTSCYLRIRFQLKAAALDSLQYLWLEMRYDDGFVAYLNNRQVARTNAPARLAWNSAAADPHEANDAERFIISEHLADLKDGENLLAIHGLNTHTNSSDFLIHVRLCAAVDYYQNFSSNLPVIQIQTFGAEIEREQRIPAEMQVLFHEDNTPNRLTDSPTHYAGRISIEGRGSSSWGFDKKSFNIETQDSLGNNFNCNLLGLPKENDWILYGPFSDKSLLRNVLIFNLARKIDRYASRSRLCELFLNGDYRGVYVLLEKIKQDDDRLDLAEMTPTANDGDSLTGGYIIKIDKEDYKPGFASKYPPALNPNHTIKYQYHYPKADQISSQQANYIQDFMDHFENIMAGENFANPKTGYPAIIHMKTFVDFFILNEISKNVDGYRLSTFLYKDRDSVDGRLCMGPIWDFNLGFGNADYYNGQYTDGWELEFLLNDSELYKDYYQVPFWWKKLFNDRLFRSHLHARWRELRAHILREEQIADGLDSLYTYSKAARLRNFERWDILGRHIWPNFFVGDTYEEEYEFLIQWIFDRLAWMDDAIAGFPLDLPAFTSKTLPKNWTLAENFPNPFNLKTTIQYELGHSAEVQITIYNSRGRKIRTLVQAKKAPGRHQIVWDGTESSGQTVASGIYFCRIRIGGNNRGVFTRKMVVLK